MNNKKIGACVQLKKQSYLVIPALSEIPQPS